ncbi:MAG: glycosyltransferase [Saprospiraceae bacterium]
MDHSIEKIVWLIVFTDIKKTVNAGILQKSLAQQNAFESLGCKVVSVTMYGDEITDLFQNKLSVSSSFLRRYSFFKFLLQKINKTVQIPDYIYIRYPFSTPLFIWFLRKLKQNFSQSKVIIELPTYPYNKEFTGLSRWKLILDESLQKLGLNWVDLLVVIGNYSIFPGTKTLSISNGIEVKSTELENRTFSNPIKMVAVGHWRNWHGLDRLIKGMVFYYHQKPKVMITLQIIGEGPEVKVLKDLVEQNILSDYVEFLGEKNHEAVEIICQQCDIGIGVLGAFRKGLNIQSPLKHRMYVANGLPLILSTQDSDLPGDLPFVLEFEANESPINMEKVVDFVQKLTFSRMEIYQYAVKNFSWNSRMETILQHVKTKN